MPLRYQHRVLQHLAHPSYEPKDTARLGVELGFGDELDGFGEAVRALEADGKIALDGSGRVTLPGLPDQGEIEGVFRGSAKGFGFVETIEATADGDIFIPEHSTGGALSGDRVLIAFQRDRRREQRQGMLGKSFAGEVIEVVQRARSTFTGEIGRQGDTWLAWPDGKELTDPVVIRDASSKNAKIGDKVAFEIVVHAEGRELAEAVITKVLGAAGEPDVETQAVIAAYSLPENEFPAECVEQAREASRGFEAMIERWKAEGESALEQNGLPRKDITDVYITTIDPPDAKDYDDAISIRRLTKDEAGYDGWELGVHIADVAHFIDPGSSLDEEGYDRGNSCYLPRLVIPMLPEILSNGICSLQEGVPRFAKTAWMRYDQTGKVRAQGVQNTLIESRKRMTYLEAQALIDGDLEEAKKHAKTEPEYTDELIDAVREMDRLARTIQARRRTQGMISLELPDTELVFDEDGNV
ncbi:MAG: RNB domain-containing ribonuclease, partial [Planctomycetota bacterium]